MFLTSLCSIPVEPLASLPPAFLHKGLLSTISCMQEEVNIVGASKDGVNGK